MRYLLALALFVSSCVFSEPAPQNGAEESVQALQCTTANTQTLCWQECRATGSGFYFNRQTGCCTCRPYYCTSAISESLCNSQCAAYGKSPSWDPEHLCCTCI